MFANEEFDLDEDFLNDLTQKESAYYSQTIVSDESSSKRFKNDEDICKPSCSTWILNIEAPDRARSREDSSVTNIKMTAGNKNTRTNSILERLKQNRNVIANNSIHKNIINIESQTSHQDKPNSAQETFSHPGGNESRKNLILDIFKRNNVENVLAGPSSSKETFIPNNLNISSNNSKSEESNIAGKSLFKSAKPISKSVTLVRQFPGPAGLLPDLSDESIPIPISELSHFEDSNDGTNADAIENTSIVSKYCSQNTTNLFSDGAWQLLMNDLSEDFSTGHDISIIQQNVLTNSYKNNKIPFLAGIVLKVDFSRPDPTVILKDCTGTIEGTICKDILAKYPHCLDIGSVLVLGNVSLLTVGSYFKKCHIVVTMKTIINIYIGKTQIFSTSEMNRKLEKLRTESVICNQISDNLRTSNSKLENKSNIECVKINKNTDTGLNLHNLKNTSNLNSSSSYVNKNTDKYFKQPAASRNLPAVVKKQINSNTQQFSNIECKDPPLENKGKLNNFQANKNSLQSTNHKNIKSTFESEDFEDFDDEFSDSFFDIKDNLVSETTTKINSTVNKDVKTNQLMSLNENNIAEVKKNSVLNPIQMNVCNEKANEPNIFNKEEVANKKPNLSRSSDIKLKLSVFKSDSELTQSFCDDFDTSFEKSVNSENIDKKKKEHSETSSALDLLLNKENDSDDEFFSQLDI